MYTIIRKLNRLGNNFEVFEISILRMLIGGYILFNGVSFFQHNEVLEQLVDLLNINVSEFVIVHMVILGHIVGGLLILFGLLTRVASLIQIPILIGAVIVNFVTSDPVQFLASVMVLVGLMFITVLGSGKASVDYTLKMHM
jgi:uncharacterized membrane protein YphA (DoxX/SURF4 family)